MRMGVSAAPAFTCALAADELASMARAAAQIFGEAFASALAAALAASSTAAAG